MSGRLIKVVDGIPTPVDGEPITREQMHATVTAAAAIAYKHRKDPEGNLLTGEEDFFRADGTPMSLWEVAQIRRLRKCADGDIEAIRQVEDRLLGKPKQEVQSVTVSVTMKDWLAKLAEEEQNQHQARQQLTRVLSIEAEDIQQLESDISISDLI